MTPLLICNLCEEYSVGPKGVFCGVTGKLLEVFTDNHTGIYAITPTSCPARDPRVIK